MVLMHYEGQTLSVEPIKKVDLLTEILPFFCFVFSSPLMISGRSVFFFNVLLLLLLVIYAVL